MPRLSGSWFAMSGGRVEPLIYPIQLLVIGCHHKSWLGQNAARIDVQHVTHHALCRVLVRVPPPKMKGQSVVVSGEQEGKSLPKTRMQVPLGQKAPPSYPEPDHS